MRPERPAPGSRTLARRRTRWIGVVGIIVLVAGIVQLFMIQIVRGADLAEQGRVVRTSATSVEAPRGPIVDASGQVLVDSVSTHHIAVNQKQILEYQHVDDQGRVVGRGPAEAAKLLAPLLGKNEVELGGELIGDNTYSYLAKDVDTKTYRQIRKLGIYGIEWEPSFQRVYPGGSTAAPILGAVGAEGTGTGGLELIYNEELTGVAGEEAYEIGPTGAVIPGAKATSKEAKPGATVHTSINADLQYSVQDSVDKAVKKTGADWGSAVLIDVPTSQVVVLADSGSEKPSGEPQASHSVQDVFEPGSIGKILTFASALELGAVEPETTFTMEDTYTTGGETFKDYSEHPRKTMTAAGILAQSLNTGTVMVGEQVKDKDRWKTMKAFGIGDLTGIELGGESAGLLAPPEDWYGRTRFTTMFGQGYALTNLQAANMAATIAREGVWRAPRLVTGITEADGKFEPAESPAPREAIRPEVAATLLTMMEGVTSADHGGSAVLSAVDGYRIAGKTGTAEIGGDDIAASMVAVVPADDPQVAVSVLLYKPKRGESAGDIAAPLMQAVVLDAIRALDIQPSKEAPKLYPAEPKN